MIAAVVLRFLLDTAQPPAPLDLTFYRVPALCAYPDGRTRRRHAPCWEGFEIRVEPPPVFACCRDIHAPPR